jgi:SAM-dependent methyltransferase
MAMMEHEIPDSWGMTYWDRPTSVLEALRLGAFRPGIPDWEPDLNGLTLNLGAGEKLIKDSVPLDLPEWNGDEDGIPYPEESVANIYALHFLEHLHDPLNVLRECQRVLQPRGHLNVVVPHWDTQLAHSDLDHKTYWDEETWSRIFGNTYYEKNHSGWRFRIGTNVLMGIDARNLLIITQLIKELQKVPGNETK